jgi:hypothetical protein
VGVPILKHEKYIISNDLETLKIKEGFNPEACVK